MYELFDAVKEIAENAAEKADTVYRAALLKLSVITLNRILSEHYRDLGAAIYKMCGTACTEQKKKELSEEIAAITVQIYVSRKRIAGFQKRIDEIMGLIRCPDCGSAVRIKNAYCSACGRRLTAAEEEKVEENENEMNIPDELYSDLQEEP